MKPVRVYDTSGPWSDPSVTLGSSNKGFRPFAPRLDPEARRLWNEESKDESLGQLMMGYLSDKHSAIAAKRRSTFNGSRAAAPPRRKPLRASADHPVTSFGNGAAQGHHHARDGIHRDSRKISGRPVAGALDPGPDRTARAKPAANNLGFAHHGEPFGAKHPA